MFWGKYCARYTGLKKIYGEFKFFEFQGIKLDFRGGEKDKRGGKRNFRKFLEIALRDFHIYTVTEPRTPLRLHNLYSSLPQNITLKLFNRIL
jgi:hypothetical protein